MKKRLLKISLVGKTNAGKSTLINNLIGEDLSIVNKKINTTEDLIIGIYNYKQYQVIFYDTPGISNLKTLSKKNNKLKQNLWNGINQSDLIVYLVDVKTYRFSEIKLNIVKLEEVKKKIILIFNKNDLIKKNSVLPKIEELNKNLNIEAFFSISAKKKLGLNKFKKFLLTKTYSSKWIYKENEISDKDDIFISNESTRNAILTLLHKEIPYNLKITNIIFKYLKNGHLKIKQVIEIDNPRYKKIILGKNGNKIKQIRQRSQNYITELLRTKVHLYINIVMSNAK